MPCSPLSAFTVQAKYKNEPKDLEESENDDDDEESSDSEEEDEDGVLAGDVAGEFMSVLSRIVTRDPTLKQEKKFFGIYTREFGRADYF